MTNYRFRTNWCGKMILQRAHTYRNRYGDPDRLWEDADAGDLQDYYKQLYKTTCKHQLTREQFESECG